MLESRAILLTSVMWILIKREVLMWCLIMVIHDDTLLLTQIHFVTSIICNTEQYRLSIPMVIPHYQLAFQSIRFVHCLCFVGFVHL